jgi:hypothetical protein
MGASAWEDLEEARPGEEPVPGASVEDRQEGKEHREFEEART